MVPWVLARTIFWASSGFSNKVTTPKFSAFPPRLGVCFLTYRQDLDILQNDLRRGCWNRFAVEGNQHVHVRSGE
jgi:hypothetical protein